MAMNDDQKAALQEELEKKKRVDDLNLMAIQIQDKHKYENFRKYCFKQAKEIEHLEQAYAAQTKLATDQALIERDEKLAVAMKKMKQDEMTRERLRQVLCSTSPEIKELQAKLKIAYNNKELMNQIHERERAKLMEKVQEKEVQRKLEEARLKEEDYKRQLKEKSIMDKHRYKLELQNQMIHQERTKRYQYEEFLQEKKFVDDLVERIHEEDEREIEMKRCKMLETQQEIRAFQTAQEIWKAKERQQLEDEDRKIKEFIKEKSDLRRFMKEEADRIGAIKAAILDKLSIEIYKEKRREEERLQIINDLFEEERKAAYDKELRDQRERREKMKVEILDSLKQQMREREEARKKQAEEDAAFKEALIAKYAEENRLEQLSNEKRRLKMLQIKKDVEEMITAKRQKKAEEIQQQLILADIARKEEEERQTMIEEERIKLLNEHAKILVDHLPPGTVKLSDLDKLEPELAELLRISRM